MFDFTVKKHEIVSVIFALLSIGIITFTTIKLSGSTPQLIRYTTTGFDNATHLSILTSVYKNQGYIYGNSSKKLLFWPELSFYPQGWHLSSAIIWRGLSNNFSYQHIGKLLIAYFAIIMIWYFVIIYLLSLAIFLLILKLNKIDKIRFLDYVLSLGFLIITQMYVTFLLLREGFSNYLALIAYVITAVILLICLYDSKLKGKHYLILSSMIAASFSFSWLLAAPIGYLMVIMPFLPRTVDKKVVQKYVTSLLKNKTWIVISAIILFVGVLQGLVQFKYGQGISQINSGPSFLPINHYLLIILLVCSIFVIITKFVKDHSTSLLYINILVPSTLITGLIYIYEDITSQTIGYYSEKVAIILFLVLMLMFVPLASSLVKNTQKKIGLTQCTLILISLIIAIPMFFDLNITDTAFAFGSERKLSTYTANQISNLIYSKVAYTNRVIVFKHLDYSEDLETTRFLTTLKPNEDKCSSDIVNEIMSNWVNHSVVNAVNTCAADDKNTDFYIIASKDNFNYFAKQFAGNNNVHLILSN